MAPRVVTITFMVLYGTANWSRETGGSIHVMDLEDLDDRGFISTSVEREYHLVCPLSNSFAPHNTMHIGLSYK